MGKEKVYFDTSVLSAYYDKRSPERQEATSTFWEEVMPDYRGYISEITVEEIKQTKDMVLRKKLTRLTQGFTVLKVNEKIRDLAQKYVEREIFPEKYIEDALHVAVASFYGVSYMVSWNFTHLVKVKTRRLVNSVNILEGFKEIEIVSPQEL